MTWIKYDASNRAWRTMLQGIVATLVIPGADAALQVLARALTDSHGSIDWEQVAISAGFAALTAVVMAATAYVHRAYVDPSSIPSATPPSPPWAEPPEKTSPRTQR